MIRACRSTRLAVLFTGLLCLAACSSVMLGVADHRAWAKSMEGRSIKDLLPGLGKPYKIEDLGGGNKLYTWRMVLADHTGPQMRTRPQRDGRPVFLTEYTGPAHYNTGHLRLWVDGTGKVFRSQWDHKRTSR